MDEIFFVFFCQPSGASGEISGVRKNLRSQRRPREETSGNAHGDLRWLQLEGSCEVGFHAGHQTARELAQWEIALRTVL
jgi:hypothetical protein